MRTRLRGGPVLLAAALLAAGCSVSDSPFPSTGSLLVTLRSTGLGFQSSPEARVQYVRWEVARLVGTLDDGATEHPFVTSLPCLVAATPVGDGDVRRCGGSGLTLTSLTRHTVDFHLEVSRLDGIAASRPELPDAGDYDGDGVPNQSDNCKLVPNPLEDDGSGGLAQPKTCYLTDSTGQPTLPDQDLDAVPDATDNCLYFANPLGENDTFQPDSNVNGIGDACELTLAAALPAGGLALQCSGEFTIAENVISQFAIDFTSALNCDVAGGTCTLDVPAVGQDTAIVLRRSGLDIPSRCVRVDPL